MNTSFDDKSFSTRALKPEQLRDIIQNATKTPIDDHYPTGILTGQPRFASVLVPFLFEKENWSILFIRRTHVDGDIHSGQVAFPGGGAEAGDVDFVQTALRETNEETGILPEQVNIIGNLGPLKTISNFVLTPVIGILQWPIELKPSPTEVDRIFTIPLEWLINRNNRVIKMRSIPGNPVEFPVIFFNEYDHEVLWGASARIMVQLIQLIENSFRNI